MEDHLEAIKILRCGLISNPGDPLLLNNLAYSSACIGELDAAKEALERIVVPSDDPSSTSVSVMKTATAGLLEYRKGNPSLGRSLYLRAFESARDADLDHLRARLVLFFALEEARAGFPLTNPVAKVALETGERTSDPVLRLLLKRLLKAQSENETVGDMDARSHKRSRLR
jgi:hypothetical protein